MLYDRLLLALNRSTTALASPDGDHELVHDELVRAQRIVDEPRFAHDLDQGGEIAANLRDIYDYSHEQLLLANTRKDATQLPSLIEVFTELRTAWHEGVERTQPVG